MLCNACTWIGSYQYLLIKLDSASWQFIKQQLPALMPAQQERHFVVLLRKVFHGLSGYAVVGSQFARGVIMAHLIDHQAMGGEPEMHACTIDRVQCTVPQLSNALRCKELTAIVRCSQRKSMYTCGHLCHAIYANSRRDCAIEMFESYAELRH